MSVRRGLATRGTRSALLASVCSLVLWWVVPATPAAAHAVLLRTTPAPQSTLTHPPAAVRLEFSESVDVAFGAIRVYDVDAHRVDTGAIRHAANGRSVVVPVRPHLAKGTYSVTWRAVSADGHAVRGGFSFYIGAPSTISPAAVPEDHGATRLTGWLGGTARFAWFACILFILGSVAVRRWVWTPALASVGVTIPSPAREIYRRAFRRHVISAWALLLIAGVARLALQGASVSGLPLGRALRPSVASRVLASSYGHLWQLELLFALLLGIPLAGLVSRRWMGPPRAWLTVFAVGAVALAIATARNGHARTDPHPLPATASLALHLLALSVWVGGLAGLVTHGRAAWRSLRDDERPAVVRAVVARFSALAVVMVVVVVLTGTINSWFEFAGVSDLWHTAYGRAVAAKVVLLALALVLAARHMRIVPRNLADPTRGIREVAIFERTATAEMAVLGVTVAVAAALVAMVPGRSLALGSGGPVTVERRAGDMTVQLFVDDTSSPPELHLTFVDSSGVAVSDVSDVTVVITTPKGSQASVTMRLLSPGHLVGDAPAVTGPGRYRFAVAAQHAGTRASVTVVVPVARRPLGAPQQ